MPHREHRLARFRPTATQAAVRGSWRGLAAAACVAIIGLVVATAELVHIPTTAWWVGLVGPVVVAALDGAMRGRDHGVDVDEYGLWPQPTSPRAVVPWEQVADIHPERRHHRTVVAVTTSDGQVVRLAAPYDGPLLARDGQFERKLFTLRHLWETRRRWQA